MYQKYLQSDEHHAKILNSAMHFYVSSYNLGLKAGRDELNKPLSSLRLAECDSDDEDVQYVPDNLLIKKPTKALPQRRWLLKLLPPLPEVSQGKIVIELVR